MSSKDIIEKVNAAYSAQARDGVSAPRTLVRVILSRDDRFGN